MTRLLTKTVMQIKLVEHRHSDMYRRKDSNILTHYGQRDHIFDRLAERCCWISTEWVHPDINLLRESLSVCEETNMTYAPNL